MLLQSILQAPSWIPDNGASQTYPVVQLQATVFQVAVEYFTPEQFLSHF